jgi:hypothetical protein
MDFIVANLDAFDELITIKKDIQWILNRKKNNHEKMHFYAVSGYCDCDRRDMLAYVPVFVPGRASI